MKKLLLSVTALLAAIFLNAQEVCVFNADNSLNLDGDNGTALTAGTVIGETESIVARTGADDIYKPNYAAFSINGTDICGGLQGGTNPKDADGGLPATTLLPPASGAFLQFEAKADGFLYVMHKASSNKAYSVFEEGTAISYTFAAIGDATTDLGAVYQFTIPYEVENELFVVKESIGWAEQEFLKNSAPDKYAAHISQDAEGNDVWNPIKVLGHGVIKFPVYKDCDYIVNANLSKIAAAGFVFSTTDDVVIKSDNGVVIMGELTQEQEPYAVLSDDNTTLTFYYDGNKASRNGMGVGPFVYDYNFTTYMEAVNSGWYDQRESITSVVFDESFANYKDLTSTAYWFCDCSNLKTINGIENLNTANVTSMNSMFSGCSNLKSLDVSKFNTTNVTDTRNMFNFCSNLTSLDVSNFNTANVTDMRGMFSDCYNLTSLDVSKFNTANVTSMDDMFSFCYNLTSLDVSKFNTANVTSMGGMFSFCSNLTSLDLSNFNTANVTEMRSIFYGCSNLTSLDLSNFNTANVTEMYGMFAECSNLTSLDLSNFNTANVTNMRNMFFGCSNLTSLDVSKFNTANVTSMNSMFFGCSNLTSLDISNLNTANVTDMWSMFFGCSNLTSLDLSNFNTTNVTDMYGMFEGCSNLESLDVSKFNTANVTNMSSMFYGCSTLKTLYCNDSWSCDNSQGMFTACTSLVGAISYDEAKTDVTFANPTAGYFTAVAKGDANGDGEISDEDVKTAEGHIMGNKPTKYVFVGADSNGDGKINVADIVDIVNKKK